MTRRKCANCLCLDGSRGKNSKGFPCGCQCHGHSGKKFSGDRIQDGVLLRSIDERCTLDADVRTIDALSPPAPLRMPRFPNGEMLRERSQELFADTLEGGDAVLESLAGWLYDFFADTRNGSSLQRPCRAAARRQDGHFWCELFASAALILDEAANIPDEVAKLTVQYRDAADFVAGALLRAVGDSVMAPLRAKGLVLWMLAAAMCSDTSHCVEFCQAIEDSIRKFLLGAAAKEFAGQLSALLARRS